MSSTSPTASDIRFFKGGTLTPEGIREVRQLAEQGLDTKQILARINEPQPEAAPRIVTAYVAVSRRQQPQAEQKRKAGALVVDGELTDAGRAKVRSLAQQVPKMTTIEILARVAPDFPEGRMRAYVAVARRRKKK